MGKYHIPDGNFFTGQSFMANELDLHGDELMVYAIIYGFSQDGTSKMIGGLSYLAAWLGKSKRSAQRAVDALVEKGLVIKHERLENKVRYCDYTVAPRHSVDAIGYGAGAMGGMAYTPQGYGADATKNITLDNKDIDNRDIYSSAFDEFWQAYPKHKDKAAAEKSFEKVMKSGVPLETLLTAIERQKKTEQWSRDGGQFIPYPSTWLNRKKWEDEVQDSEIGESGVPKWCITKDEPQYDPDTGELLPF